jgi:hypothetical protein
MKNSTETQPQSTPKIRLFVSLVLAVLVSMTVPLAEPEPSRRKHTTVSRERILRSRQHE